MKDCQKVYIKGNPNRGAEVIKALTDLGGVNSWTYTGDNEKALYYINPSGKIERIYDYEFSPECLLLKEFYREITLPKEKWTDGDLLVQYNGEKKEYMVYSHDVKGIELYAIMTHIWISDEKHSTYSTRLLCDASNAKIASEDDIKCFQELLHERGKEWDFKNKKLIDWEWKPEINKDYWYINDIGEVCRTNYNKLMPNNDYRIQIGNCFQTKDDAFSARDKIDKILLNK